MSLISGTKTCSDRDIKVHQHAIKTLILWRNTHTKCQPCQKVPKVDVYCTKILAHAIGIEPLILAPMNLFHSFTDCAQPYITYLQHLCGASGVAFFKDLHDFVLHILIQVHKTYSLRVERYHCCHGKLPKPFPRTIMLCIFASHQGNTQSEKFQCIVRCITCFEMLNTHTHTHTHTDTHTHTHTHTHIHTHTYT